MSPRLATVLLWAALPLRVYMGMVFIAASLYKIYEPFQFALSVATYQMVPLEVINLFALALPWVELVVGVTMVLGLWTRESSLLIIGMMVMFMAALLYALSRDLQMSCGCFASQDAADEIGWHTIARDSLWLLASLFVCFFDTGRLGLDRFLSPRTTMGDNP